MGSVTIESEGAGGYSPVPSFSFPAIQNTKTGGMKRITVVLVLLIFTAVVVGQKKWKGGDAGSWNDPVNWEPAGVPLPADEVVLDNSLWPSTYVVTLPSTAVTVNKLLITPSSHRSISVILPKENLASPALILQDSKDALVIDS